MKRYELIQKILIVILVISFVAIPNIEKVNADFSFMGWNIVIPS